LHEERGARQHKLLHNNRNSLASPGVEGEVVGAMNRADKITAEPKADDLLASIRRAINEEGMDELASRREPQRQFERPRLVSDRPERPAADPRGIAALREKISRELNQAEPEPVNGHAKAQPAPSLSQSLFASLLGGERQDSSLTSPPALVQAGSSDEMPLAQAAPVGRGRQQPLPLAPRLPSSAAANPPLRSAFDEPGRNASYRPPFGQSAIGIRSFQPPGRPAPDAMISPEATSVAASSFNRLSEQIFGREGTERSIDDLARELLHPMLKQWLDQNLPRLVEKLVREEIERVARRSR
jgi:cell pole-organizing protein PopZ